MRIMVTGGAGFIGSNFIKYMLRHHPSDSIINYDKLSYAGNLETLVDVEDHPNYMFVRGDISDSRQVEQVVSTGVDVIVNFAAESHVDRSIIDPEVFVRTNVLGTQVLLEVARRQGVAKYIQVSTDEVYGTLGPDGLFTEETPLQPNSPYSASKASADLLVRAYSETYGMDVNITRCSNNYGQYQFPEKLVPLMIINAMQNKTLPVYGDGLQVRDWLYVSDHCRAIDLVMRKGNKGAIYNIGGNNEKTNYDVVLFILEMLQKPQSLIKHVADRPGHDRRYAIDASRIKNELGWQPQHNFVDGMQKTIKWYMENVNWWQSVINGEYRDYVERRYAAAAQEDFD